MRSGAIGVKELYHSVLPLLVLLYGQLDILFKHTVKLFKGSVGRWVVE